MDTITNKFLSDFCKSYEINIDDKEKAFEYFANLCCINKENGYIDVRLDDLYTGNNAPGIDGIGIIVNNKLVTNVSEIEYQIQNNRVLDVKFVFIQSKTSSSFDNSLMLNFFEFTKAFFSGDNDFSTPEMLNFLDMKNCIYDNAEYMTGSNPRLSMYYVTTGKWIGDKTLCRLIDRNVKELQDYNILSDIQFTPCGAIEIQNYYRMTKNSISTKFKMEKMLVMFSDDENDNMGYSGVIPFKEFKKIIIDDNNLLKPVFDDNIRDFLGDRNPVNKAITETLQKLDVNSFCMLNNGITIISDRIQVTGTTVVLTDYQIVNGCQTSHVLYDNRLLPGIEELLIPIKIIGTTNDEIKNGITKATNSQTSIKPEQLEALSDFQKDLEIYYSAIDEEHRLYYERRTGQYRLEDVAKTKIVNIPSQIKSVSAMFINNPHGVSGNYGKIVKAVGNRIFNPDDAKIIYYTSSYAQYKIERLIASGSIDKSYNKARYHAMMLFRIFVAGKKVPKFSGNKIESYCKKILDVLYDDEKCEFLFSAIIEFISKQMEIDFSDRKTFERKETTDYLLAKTNKLKEYIISIPESAFSNE